MTTFTSKIKIAALLCGISSFSLVAFAGDMKDTGSSGAGETKIETKGFVGSSCRDASRFLEEALGVNVEERPTAEFYQQGSQEQQIAREGI